MSLSLLQMRLKKNEEDFARLNSISFDDEVKDVKKKMPGENNPWSGELKARRKKSRTAEAEDEGEWDENEDWEWEEEEEEAPAKCNGVKNDDKPVDAVGKPKISITENLVTIDRSKVDWSDDEFDEEDDEPETNAPPPPPPPPGPPAPPPPPPAPPGVDKKPSFKSDRVEQLKKKPTKRVDWNDLMQEISQYRCPGGLLKKTVCNDRSKPILSKSKVKGVFVYESEKHSKEADILKEISTGARLKRVKTNDRSKPNLKGIKSFKRQLTKEEKLDKGFSFGDDAFEEVGELEDLEKLKDDLESTKQLLELEVRSKNLLEKDNKKLQAEIERLKSEFSNHKEAGDQTPDILNNILTRERKESISKERRESIKEKKKSIIDNINNEVIENTTCESEVQKIPVEQVPEEVFEEIDELKEEAEEARKLAEEWEAKYKEMQRQMEMLDGPGGMYGKKNSTAGIERPSFQRMLSTASSDGVEDTNNRASAAFGEPEEDDWMQKREVTQLQTKLRNTKDKKEIIVRERNLLSERIDNLKESIAKEFEARKNLKKDVKDMNAAFKEEMADMEAEEETQKNLEDCYWSDEDDLVKNPYAKEEKENSADDDSAEMADFMEEDDLEESVEEILKSAEECEEVVTDPGAGLFNAHFNEDSDTEGEPDANDHILMSDHLNKRIERESEKVTLMRKSNFALKSKIDILYDILQTQKEKHFDLKQELNRMLSDIQ